MNQLIDFVRTGIILLSVFLAGTSAFHCYTCRNGESCDDVTEQMKTHCTSPLGAINTCIKAKVSGNVIRGCGVPGTNINKCMYDGAVSVCMCETDLCNAAPGNSRLNLMGPVAAAVLFGHIWNAPFRRFA